MEKGKKSENSSFNYIPVREKKAEKKFLKKIRHFGKY